jgi:hypothetical protein
MLALLRRRRRQMDDSSKVNASSWQVRCGFRGYSFTGQRSNPAAMGSFVCLLLLWTQWVLLIFSYFQLFLEVFRTGCKTKLGS